jgi:hypothetical protein
MALTKKDFIALADIIRRDNLDKGIKGTTFPPLAIQSLAEFCEKRGANFDRARFMAYIKGEGK